MNSRTRADGVPSWVWVAVPSLVIGLWCLAWFLTVKALGTPQDPGQFGDMFGAVNALFSGLALAGVVLTLFLQHRELGLQRQELSLTREQLTRTAEAQEASQAALARQAEANERAAEIAGLVAVVENYKIRIQRENQPSKKLEYEREQDALIEKLTDLIGQD